MELHPIQEKLLRLSQTQNLDELSLREIARLIGISHPQQVKHHKEQLRKNGYLAPRPVKEELPAIEPLLNHQLIEVPILGAANCGQPILSATEGLRGYVSISPKLLAKTTEIFAVVARGDSMNQAHIGPKQKSITDGDYVIIDASNKQPNSGDYVLSVINGAANIKRFYTNEDAVILKSESVQEYPPIFLAPNDGLDYFVNGVVLDVIKSC